MRKARFTLSIVGLLPALLCGPGGCPSTSTEPHLELIGQLRTSSDPGGGPALQDTHPLGTLLYATYTSGFHDVPGEMKIFDISNPAQPKLAETSIETVGALPDDLWIENDLLLMLDQSVIDGISYAYLESFDLSDPGHPAPLDAFMTERSGFLALAVDQNAAYVGHESILQKFSVFDISNPANLSLAASIEVRQEVPVFNIRLADDTAFLANSGVGVSAVDISSPFDPRFLGSFEIPYGNIVDLEIVEHYAFVPWNTGPESEISQLLVLDVTDPSAMKELSNLPLGRGAILSVTRGENLLFIANQRVHEDEILLIDITDREDPRWIGKTKIPEELGDAQGGLHVRDDLLYVGCGGGIAIYRIVSG